MARKKQQASPPPVAGDFDWALARSFLAVMRAGSLSGAARLISTAQPTVGRHIRALEAMAGDTLFDRKASGFHPTDRALELFERAVAAEGAVAALAQTIQAPAAELAGVVRITTSTIFGVEVLPELIARLMEAAPGLEFVLHAHEGVENLLGRDADIAVRFVRPAQPDLIATKVAEVAVGLFASRGYIERQGTPATMEDLAGHSFVTSEGAGETKAIAQARQIDLRHDQLRLRTDNLLARIAAVRAGAGIGPCHVWLAQRYPELVRVMPDWDVARLPVWVVAHDDLKRSRRLRFVFDYLVTELKQAFGAAGSIP